MSFDQSAAKKKLRRTWLTFFGKYGKLLPIQLETIPVVLERKNALIISSTASGKTEAIVAPLIERNLEEKWSGLSIIYITPTRALVNDIHKRLKEQLEELGVKISMKTGDRPSFNPNKPTNFLITTPESLDSLICRHRKNFRNIMAIVIDEVHLIDNTYRGDQLRILLKRLEDISTNEFNIYALSATISNPLEIGGRYLKNFEVLKTSGGREIEYTLHQSLAEVFNQTREENLKKLLIFCNKRDDVELLSTECKKIWGKDLVVSHHGSLSKNVREDAESFMRETKYGVCVATSTLEIGIDIGDIDAVVLADIPWSTSSLLQRIGRGGRRTQKCRVFAIYHSLEEKVLLERMFRIAIGGKIEQFRYSPDLSVVVQQVFSLLYGTPNGITLEYFNKIFKDFCPDKDLENILKYLSKRGWIEKKYSKWYATEKLMDKGERGEIHSNIPSNRVLKVIDINSGRSIGDIQYPIDNIFALAGKIWELVRVTQSKVYVRSGTSETFTTKFKSYASKGRFHYLLPADLKYERDGASSLNDMQLAHHKHDLGMN